MLSPISFRSKFFRNVCLVLFVATALVNNALGEALPVADPVLAARLTGLPFLHRVLPALDHAMAAAVGVVEIAIPGMMALRLDQLTMSRPAPAPSGLEAMIRTAGLRYAVDPQLVREVVRQESDFHNHTVSNRGALGLMQLMPRLARDLGVRRPFDPQQNLDGGTRYLHSLLKLYNGNVPLSLAAYNAGPGAVAKYGNQVPPYKETQQYVRVITRRYVATIAAGWDTTGHHPLTASADIQSFLAGR